MARFNISIILIVLALVGTNAFASGEKQMSERKRYHTVIDFYGDRGYEEADLIQEMVNEYFSSTISVNFRPHPDFEILLDFMRSNINDENFVNSFKAIIDSIFKFSDSGKIKKIDAIAILLHEKYIYISREKIWFDKDEKDSNTFSSINELFDYLNGKK